MRKKQALSMESKHVQEGTNRLHESGMSQATQCQSLKILCRMIYARKSNTYIDLLLSGDLTNSSTVVVGDRGALIHQYIETVCVTRPRY
jgi:hypothetical protein